MSERPPKRSLDELIAEIAEGSHSAVWELMDRYYSNVQRIVRRNLPVAIRSKVDSTDIVQSVWHSLLRRPPQLNSTDAFLSYLISMAKNKIIEKHRRYVGTHARDVRRERPLAIGRQSDEDAAGPIDSLPSHGNTPSAVAIAREAWNSAIESAGDRARQIVELRLQGLRLDDVAERLGISTSTVRRTLDHMLQSLSK
jgi:RNA polymerase sigma factor (sigma-70 family)